jgi:hypothetical protein
MKWRKQTIGENVGVVKKKLVLIPFTRPVVLVPVEKWFFALWIAGIYIIR